MSTSGIQAFDSTGTLILDTTTNVLKWLGTYSVGWNYTGATQSGQLLVPEFGLYPNNKPFIVSRDGQLDPNTHANRPTWWIEGNYLKWSYPLSDAGTNGLYRTNSTVSYGLI